ncbi:hypothetical protein [Dendronalium sp. ChiSLP03b]|nr:hypothetical protein [Dendronalium sp. ChiSLP03b]MDZ8205492.1 hypothetical protein [Dendronalium sp. ChiSLP03b]
MRRFTTWLGCEVAIAFMSSLCVVLQKNYFCLQFFESVGLRSPRIPQ